MADKQFVYLVGSKVKVTIVDQGEESWLECCHFLENGMLWIFKVTILDDGNSRQLKITERTRNQEPVLILSDNSRANRVNVFRRADRAIADRISDLNTKLAAGNE